LRWNINTCSYTSNERDRIDGPKGTNVNITPTKTCSKNVQIKTNLYCTHFVLRLFLFLSLLFLYEELKKRRSRGRVEEQNEYKLVLICNSIKIKLILL
ncbi:hypothetical protein BpHYR1_017470, partial [Brachionus plicatilis]